jgi:hypothetical protein
VGKDPFPISLVVMVEKLTGGMAAQRTRSRILALDFGVRAAVAILP